MTLDDKGQKMSKSLGNVVEMGKVTQQLGAEIIRLWCAATDYSGDLGIDDKILARVVDAYRRIRNTLRFLLANTSDFDVSTDAVPLSELLEIDRYALARAAQLQADIRVVAATNVDLSAAVAQGKFRQDLLYRLNVYPIRVPSLRERGADIDLLFKKFATDFAERYRIPVLQLMVSSCRTLLG